VLGYAQLLAGSQDRPDLDRDLSRIVESARRCQRIVHNLLSFARKHPAERKLHDLNACVRKVLELKSYQLRAAKIETVLSLTEPLPAALFDFHQIEQVLVNPSTTPSVDQATGRPGRLLLRTFATETEVGSRSRTTVRDPRRHAAQGVRPVLHDRTRAPAPGSACPSVWDRRSTAAASAAPRPPGRALRLWPSSGPRESPKSPPRRIVRRPWRLLGASQVVLGGRDGPLVLDLFSRLLKADGRPYRPGRRREGGSSSSDFDLIVTDLGMPTSTAAPAARRRGKPVDGPPLHLRDQGPVQPESLEFLEACRTASCQAADVDNAPRARPGGRRVASRPRVTLLRR
jgi:hypothetical protein